MSPLSSEPQLDKKENTLLQERTGRNEPSDEGDFLVLLLGVLEDLSRPYLRFFLFHELQQPLNRRSHTVSVILNISNLKIDSLLFLSAGKWSELLFHFLSPSW